MECSGLPKVCLAFGTFAPIQMAARPSHALGGLRQVILRDGMSKGGIKREHPVLRRWCCTPESPQPKASTAAPQAAEKREIFPHTKICLQRGWGVFPFYRKLKSLISKCKLICLAKLRY